ncbi:MAG: hydroxymethylglutaryl-CoA reductase, degradative [Deltaproteobacteria bacterium]|nr:hydroxymethylglutaryl-CoA reductase, degradative [Deltaproteobacteria bacterium]
MNISLKSSRLPGWHRHSAAIRGRKVSDWLGAGKGTQLDSLWAGGLSIRAAERLVENVVGIFGLPFSVAPNFIVNGRELLVPMVIEEPSVVAAAANAARIARFGGGFQVSASEPVMICQVQLFANDLEKARIQVEENEAELLSVAAASDKTLLRFGGGPLSLEVRTITNDQGQAEFLVLHLHVCVVDAMGANSVNSMGEALVPHLEKITAGKVGLRILTNLADQRLVTARVSLPVSSLAMRDYVAEEVSAGIVSASRFAELDPYRATTHNKGIMNGVDAVLLATGNDWRAVEAGAHAFAAQAGTYRPLCTWELDRQDLLRGQLRMPMAVGIVGGATQVHPSARLALDIMGVKKANELACIAAAVGMANNLAALRALATEGIQKGHMRLHERSRDLIADSKKID